MKNTRFQKRTHLVFGDIAYKCLICEGSLRTTSTVLGEVTAYWVDLKHDRSGVHIRYCKYCISSVRKIPRYIYNSTYQIAGVLGLKNLLRKNKEELY